MYLAKENSLAKISQNWPLNFPKAKLKKKKIPVIMFFQVVTYQFPKQLANNNPEKLVKKKRKKQVEGLWTSALSNRSSCCVFAIVHYTKTFFYLCNLKINVSSLSRVNVASDIF